MKVYIFATFCPQFAQQSCPLITLCVVLGLVLCHERARTRSVVIHGKAKFLRGEGEISPLEFLRVTGRLKGVEGGFFLVAGDQKIQADFLGELRRILSFEGRVKFP